MSVKEVSASNMNTIGETMRRERVRQGLDLQAVSEKTKIGTRMLKAMEAGDFGKLPGGVFTRSFVRQYATALGLDPAFVEAELTELNLQPEEKNSSSVRNVEPAGRTLFAESMGDSKSISSSLAWVAVAILVCGGIFFLLERSHSGSSTAERVEEKAAPVAQAVKPKSPAESNPVAANPPAAVPPAVANRSLQVVVRAREKSWVSISADGKSNFAGILQPNEKREVTAEERVKITSGNAGGIEISLNGKTIEPLGPRGQVRTVELTRSGPQVVSRTPKPAPSL
jgi:cytoskeleton protein RodZ